MELKAPTPIRENYTLYQHSLWSTEITALCQFTHTNTQQPNQNLTYVTGSLTKKLPKEIITATTHYKPNTLMLYVD